MKPVISKRLGIKQNRVIELLEYLSVASRYGTGNQRHAVSAEWSDLLFASPVTRTAGTVTEDGPVRVRPGKQDEFLNRLEREYVRRMQLTEQLTIGGIA